MTSTETQTFQIVYRHTTTARPYELHRLGCRHSTMSNLEVLGTRTGPDAKTVLAQYEAQNDGVFARIAPCAKGW